MAQATEQSAEQTVAPPEPTPKKQPREQTNTRPKPQPPHAVILHNDPINGFGFVIGVLCKVFRYGSGKATWLTLKAHVSGCSIVWTGTLEVAELKAEQVRACGPDPDEPSAKPLKVTTEPLPG